MNSPLATRRVWAIVPAAGHGARFAASAQAAVPKQYAPLLGATVLEWSLRALLAEPRVHAVVVAVAADDALWASVAAKLDHPKIQSTTGGANRQDTVANGLEFLAGRAAADDWILVHDAARPCLNAAELSALLDALDAVDAGGGDGGAGGADRPAAGAAVTCGAILAAPIVDTVKRESPHGVTTVDRQGLWRALTPQVFRFAKLRRALEEAALAGVAVTDEAQAMERMGLRPALVQGSPFNVKITRDVDLGLAAKILKMTEDAPMRVGQGFDVHAFGEGDHVVLGGVRIAHPKGVVAHSDGDVVIHALCDAVLGALGEGDIGQHFPDSDPRYRGADSRVFLREVAARMHSAGLTLINADVTVLAEAPRIAALRARMAANLSADLGTAAQRINIKATTTERLGFIGRGEGLAALATVLLGP
jgi:2-C-methyl-D-erythritol 4-phosphate cytidylyltransferase/2-C-methyl-D-erythritol 2,4-cyclodiphosphate synthase